MAGLFEWGPDPEAEGRRMESLRALYARAPSIDGVRSAENIEVVKEQTPASSQPLVSKTANKRKKQTSLRVPTSVKPEVDFKAELTAKLNAQNVFVKLENKDEAKPNPRGAVKYKKLSHLLSVAPEGAKKRCDLRREARGNAACCLFPAVNKVAHQNLPPTNLTPQIGSQVPSTPVGLTAPMWKPLQDRASTPVSKSLKAKSLGASSPSAATLTSKRRTPFRSKPLKSPSKKRSSSKFKALTADLDEAGPSNRDRSDEMASMDLNSTGAVIERKPRFKCPCCTGTTDHSESVCCPAAHRFCKTCVEKQIEKVVFENGRNGSKEGLVCLAVGCKQRISHAVLISFLPAAIYAHFDDLCSLRVAVGLTSEKPARLLTCPLCNERHSVEGKRPRKIIGHKSVGQASRCPATCIKCHKEWGPTGQHKCKKEPPSPEEAKTAKVAKPCPQCSVLMMKDRGCNRVTCNICEKSYCFICIHEIKRGEGYSHFCVHGSEGTKEKCVNCGKCKQSNGNKKRIQEALAEVEAEFQSSKAPRLS